MMFTTQIVPSHPSSYISWEIARKSTQWLHRRRKTPVQKACIPLRSRLESKIIHNLNPSRKPSPVFFARTANHSKRTSLTDAFAGMGLLADAQNQNIHSTSHRRRHFEEPQGAGTEVEVCEIILLYRRRVKL